MIQRIQTLFLLLVTIISALLLFVPFVRYEATPAALEVTLFPKGNLSMLSTMIFVPAAINLLNLIFSIFIIMQFRKRVTQMKMAQLLMALNCILLGIMLLFDYINPGLAANPPIKDYLWGAYLPILSIIASFLAARYIKKDEDLVRSADRLR